MTISTCSFAAWRAGFGQPVRVTLGSPRRPEPTGRSQWIYLAELAPRPWYFRASPERFDREYLAQLDRLAGDIFAKLDWLSGQHGPLCLCCFERRISGPADCHRRLAAHWLQQRLGIDIPELDGRR